MMGKLQTVQQLEKAIADEMEKCINDLIATHPVLNQDHLRGEIFAYEKVMGMMGRDVTLIAKVGGGGE